MFGIEDNFPFCKTAQLTYKEEEKIRKMACAQRKNEGTFFLIILTCVLFLCCLMATIFSMESGLIFFYYQLLYCNCSLIDGNVSNRILFYFSGKSQNVWPTDQSSNLLKPGPVYKHDRILNRCQDEHSEDVESPKVRFWPNFLALMHTSAWVSLLRVEIENETSLGNFWDSRMRMRVCVKKI